MCLPTPNRCVYPLPTCFEKVEKAVCVLGSNAEQEPHEHSFFFHLDCKNSACIRKEERMVHVRIGQMLFIMCATYESI